MLGFSNQDNRMKNFDRTKGEKISIVTPECMDFTTDFSEEKVQVDSLRVLSCCPRHVLSFDMEK